MKHLILILFILTGYTGLSQEMKPIIPIDSETNKIKFQAVIDEKGSKEELFNRSIYWLNDFYKDPVRITSIRDIETGKIEGTHRFRIYYWDEDSIKHIGGMINYTFVLEFKTDRYRYTINELLLKSRTNLPVEKWLDKSDPAYNKQWESYLEQIAEFVDEWSESLINHMRPEPEEVVEDDW
ncbi:MAG: hypothetical protein C0598_02770 [Marinilabiliales bacterium]|nr:MAG: hypothetical protein C0598_02770 [Marinilabiliales bacterium]